MKLKMDDATKIRTFSNIVAFGSVVLIYFIIKNISYFLSFFGSIISLISPFIIGFAIAYILSNVLRFVEKRLLFFVDHKKRRPKLKRILGVIITMLFALLVMALLISILIPQLIESMTMLANNASGYTQSLIEYVTQLLNHWQIDPNIITEYLGSWNEIITKGADLLQKIIPVLFNFSKQITTGVANFFFGFIISIYVLYHKERFGAQAKKILYSLFPQKPVEIFLSIVQTSHRTFNGFITGQLIDACIVGTLCFIGLTILQMPYALLVSVIVAVTNVIPYFGPFIGAIPSAIIILIADPIKAIWFVIFIIALQQFDGNVLCPRIVGNTIGISAFWVMFAILVGGGLWGPLGMFIGVPTFSVLYSLVRSVIEYRLQKKGMPVATQKYASEENKIEF